MRFFSDNPVSEIIDDVLIGSAIVLTLLSIGCPNSELPTAPKACPESGLCEQDNATINPLSDAEYEENVRYVFAKVKARIDSGELRAKGWKERIPKVVWRSGFFIVEGRYVAGVCYFKDREVHVSTSQPWRTAALVRHEASHYAYCMTTFGCDPGHRGIYY